MERQKIPCYCGNELEVEIPEAIDLESTPDAEEAILDGSFLSFRCESCGKLLKPEFPLRVFDRARQIDLFLVPELDRGPFSRGKIEYALENRERGRVVIGYPELVEKLKIARDGRDDRVIEVMKFYLLEKAGAPDSVRAYYYASSDQAIEFHIYGMRESEVGVSKIPLRTYDQIKSDLQSKSLGDPVDSLLEPPYVSVQKTFREAPE